MGRMIPIEEAAARLEELLEDVRNGEDVVLSKDGVPCAKLVPAAVRDKRPLGALAYPGMPDFPPELFAPMTDEELGDWESKPLGTPERTNGATAR